MAEIVEITTWPKHKNIFYEVTSSALTFEVKGAGNAIIGLTSCLRKQCEFFISIDCDAHTEIINRHDTNFRRNRQRTPNLLSVHQFRRFWISWYGGWLAFGRYGETAPIVSMSEASSSFIKYVTCGVYRDRNHVYWRFELAPLFKQPALKPLSDGKLHWVQADAQLPDGALIGGYENEFLYIMRAPHRGSLTPGKFVPSLGLGFVAWGSSSHEKSEFEILCGYDCAWVPGHDDEIPANAVEGGFIEDSFEREYIGRAKYMGHTIPGKIALSHKVCYIAFEALTIAIKDYEVLVCPNADSYNKNNILSSCFEEYSDSDDDDGEIIMF